MWESGVGNIIKYRFVLRLDASRRFDRVKDRGRLESVLAACRRSLSTRPGCSGERRADTWNTCEQQTSVGGSWSCSEEPNISSRPLIGSEGAERRNKDTWDTFVNLCLLLICPEDITAETKDKTARVKTTGLNAVWTHFLFVTPASVDWRVGMLYSLTEWRQTVKKCNQNNVYLLACHRVWVSKEFYWCHMQIRFRCRGSKLDFVEIDRDWCWCESEGKPPHDFTSRQVDETTAADWTVTSSGEAVDEVTRC